MEYLGIALTFILAGIVAELTGFGIATVSMSLLPFFFPISIALPLVALISTTATGVIAAKTNTDGLWKHMLPLIGGAAVGIPLGMYLLGDVDDGVFTYALAVFLIGYAVYGIYKKRTFITPSLTRSTSVGVVAGFLNAVFSIHGPFVGLYASANKKWNRDETRDVIATYMFFAGIFTVAGHFLAGNLDREVGLFFLYALPFLGLGIFLGAKIFSRLSERTVRDFIYLFVMAAGLLLFFQ